MYKRKSARKRLFIFLSLFCLFLFTLSLVPFFLDSGDEFSHNASDNFTDDGDGLFNLGMDIVGILSSFSHTGFPSSDIISLDNSSSIMSDRVSLYAPLINRLVLDEDGLEISPPRLYLYFFRSGVSIEDRTISSLLERPFRRRLNSHFPAEKKKKRKKSRNIYASFLTRDSILRGYRFLREHRSLLREMERKYSIPKEFLVSILFIETQLGKVTGKHYVLNVYNTLYHYDSNALLGEDVLVVRDIVSDDVEAFADLPKGEDSSFLYSAIDSMNNFIFPSLSSFNYYDILLDDNFPMEFVDEGVRYVSSEIYYDLSSYVKRKQEWSYEQLKSLIIMSVSGGIDIHNLKGSWAGAFGFCQFIPSSYLSLAKDGDGDGVIDLFIFADALASAGNYLKESGFKRGNRKKIRSSIYRYNFSTDYVNTVYNYARLLKKRNRLYRGRRYGRSRRIGRRRR